ncbi:MAG: membrane protein insertion efficiency factor YidD [Dehalococcoidia bacterium]|nr:membrane protein insertion efficiency factor YidD [Dehalococcoidia bacterium]
MKTFLLAAIRFYQRFISPGLGVACRYEPSCSRYAHEAIKRHGTARGVWMAARRLSRCRPGGGEGYDSVPNVQTQRRLA